MGECSVRQVLVCVVSFNLIFSTRERYLQNCISSIREQVRLGEAVLAATLLALGNSSVNITLAQVSIITFESVMLGLTIIYSSICFTGTIVLGQVLRSSPGSFSIRVFLAFYLGFDLGVHLHYRKSNSMSTRILDFFWLWPLSCSFPQSLGLKTG
jgi:Ca2+/Na+ antiporter